MAFCTKCGTQIPEGAAYCPNCGAQVGAEPTPSPQGSGSSELDYLARDRNAQEHWLYRLIAFVIDAVIVGVALSVLVFLVSLAVARPSFPFLFELVFFPTAASLGGDIVLVLYFTIAETVYGKSIGKSLLHLQVVNVDGTRLEFTKILLRNISKVYFILLILDVFAGLISHTRRGQKYSDYVANTNVIRAISPSSS